MKQSCFSLLSPFAPLTPIILETFKVIETRSLVIDGAHSIMFQVLTGMCSSRAHRMWSDLNRSSSERGGALQDTASHRPRVACAAQGCEGAAAASKKAAFTYSLMLPQCHMMVVAAFGRCPWLLSVRSGHQRLTVDAPSAGAAGRIV